MKLQGLSALVTGASQGLGVTIARQFVLNGANVILTARSPDKLKDVRRSLLPLCSPRQIVVATRCDVSQTQEVDALIKTAIAATSRLDILVNNASIFGPMGRLEDVSWSQWVETLNVNFLGTVYVCRAAIPHLKGAPRGKIINVSGGGAARPLPSLSAYAASKAAVVRFTEELAEEMRPYNVDVNSIAPGPLNTRFVDEAIAAGPERLGQALYDEIMRIRSSGGTPFELAANLCAYLASRQSDGVTGKLISARHDDWAKFHERIGELNATELYTMRRIDPSTVRRWLSKTSR
jgi:NAD(P)-dependent dehydrogenase (short-subunit alcohol dehydrogenase family)